MWKGHEGFHSAPLAGQRLRRYHCTRFKSFEVDSKSGFEAFQE
jgi:hypothetical protein